MLAELIEFSPAIAEWLGWRRIRKLVGSLTLGAVIIGITLSTLHQSGLGALYLLAKDKVHPLWYSEFIPVLFLVSSVFAGLSMVIFEGTISHKVFRSRMSAEHRTSHNDIVIGLARICAGAMFVYFFLKVLDFAHGRHWAELSSGWGVWYLVEIVGFVALPCVLFARAVNRESLALSRIAAVLTLVGIVLNRLNVSVIAFKWYEVERYVPSWMEIEVTLAIIFAEIWVFRWIVNRMPVLTSPPSWVAHRTGPKPAVVPQEA
jgi:Ni/Fe-hydrogenase subunit HybB-like protein